VAHGNQVIAARAKDSDLEINHCERLIFAPGENKAECIQLSGTSMAAAVVSGAGLLDISAALHEPGEVAQAPSSSLQCVRWQFAIDFAIVGSQLAHMPKSIGTGQVNNRLALAARGLLQVTAQARQSQVFHISLGCYPKSHFETLLQPTLTAICERAQFYCSNFFWGRVVYIIQHKSYRPVRLQVLRFFSFDGMAETIQDGYGQCFLSVCSKI
jgi:hypothetical protein